MASGNRLASEVAMRHPGATPFWEPLVQGRTYELDYSANYLAVPNSFRPDDLAWARGFVSGSRRSAVEAVLKRTVRFCLFKDRGYCGVGVSLPAGLICDDEKKTKDSSASRENYVFLGGFAQHDQELFPDPPYHPGIPELGVLRRHVREVFGPLYEDFVVARYHEKPLPASGGELPAIRSEPRVLFPPDLPMVTSASTTLTLSLGRGEQVKVWRSASETELWAAACLAKAPVSLCLNMAKDGDARASGFGHVTIGGSQVERSLEGRVAPRPQSLCPDHPSPDSGPPRPERKMQFRAFGRKVTISIEPVSESHQGIQTPRNSP
jgi:hypothetical protein